MSAEPQRQRQQVDRARPRRRGDRLVKVIWMSAEPQPQRQLVGVVL